MIGKKLKVILMIYLQNNIEYYNQFIYMNCIDLFCGAGGMTVGLKNVSNLNVLCGVDYYKPAVDTYKHNNPDIKSIKCDLSDIDPDTFFKEYDLSKDNIDIVVGGPPCQGFSNANNSRDVDDNRNNLVIKYIDFINYIKPKYFVMENVKGIKSLGDGYYINKIKDKLNNYNIDYNIINTKHYNVPQSRERFILVGSSDKKVEFNKIYNKNNKIKTVDDAIGYLPNLKAGESSDNYYNHKAPNHQDKTINKIKNTDQGESIYDNWNQKTKLNPNKPSPTLLAGKRPNYHKAHPYDNRGLTVRERAKIQTFPDDYHFKGTVTENRRLTGNAFPPKATEKIIKNLINI